MSERLGAAGAWALVGVLFALSRSPCPSWAPTRGTSGPPTVDPQGPLAPLVRAAGEEWDLGIPRACCVPRRPAVRRRARCC